jgi:DNA-binding CsgD family transcriptional regulator
VPQTDTARRAELLAPLALALGGAGRLEESHAALVEVLGVIPSAPAPQRLALVSACARIETELGRHGDARRRLLAALSDAPDENRAGLTFELAAAAFYDGRLQELHTWTDPAVAAAAEADEPLLLAGAEGLGALGALWIADQAQSARLLHRSTARLATLDDATLAEQLVAALYVATAQLLCERFADAEVTSARTLAVSRRTGQGQLLIPQLNVRTMALVNLLRLDAAQQTSETSEEMARLLGIPRLLHFSLWLRALVHHVCGNAAEAERAADECDAIVDGLEPSKLTRSGTCTVAAIRAEQDPERCIQRMVATAGPELEWADPTWRSWLLLRLVRAAVAMGSLGEAERWARLAAADGERFALPAGGVRAACAEAEVLLARGQPASAAARAQLAADAAELVGAPLDGVEARLLAGRALAAAGDAELAKSSMQRVAADAGHGHAFRLRDAAARELRRAGSRLSSEGRRAGQHGHLTPRERDIAELVSEGQSNKQIAAALFLSEKTVEGALTRIYAKVGVRSRAQLVRVHVEHSEPAVP